MILVSLLGRRRDSCQHVAARRGRRRHRAYCSRSASPDRCGSTRSAAGSMRRPSRFSTLAFALRRALPVRVRATAGAACASAPAPRSATKSLLLGPGLLLIVWLRTRAVRPLVVGPDRHGAAARRRRRYSRCGGSSGPSRRTCATRSTCSSRRCGVSDAPNPDVPALQPFTLRERYEAVVQYWLLGYGNDSLIAAFAAGLVIAVAIRLWLRSAWGLAVWLLAVLVLAWIDLHELVTRAEVARRAAPRLAVSRLRIVPAAAIASRPIADERTGPGRTTAWLRPAVLWTTLAYLALAFAGADTQRRKGARAATAVAARAAVDGGRGGHDRPLPPGASTADRWVGRIGVALVADVRGDAPGGNDPGLRRQESGRFGRGRGDCERPAPGGRGRRPVHRAVAVSALLPQDRLSGRYAGARAGRWRPRWARARSAASCWCRAWSIPS